MGKKNKQREDSTLESGELKVTDKIVNKKVGKEKSKHKKSLPSEGKNKNKLKAVKDLLSKSEDTTRESLISEVGKKHKKKKNKVKLEDNVINPEETANGSAISDVVKKKKKKTKAKLNKNVPKNEEITEQSISEVVDKKSKSKLEKEVGKKSKELEVKEESNSDLDNDVLNTSISDQKEEKKARRDSKPENTIFVGNLPANTKKKQLDSLFKEFGKIVSIRFRTAEGKPIFKHETRLKAEALNAYVVFDNPTSKEKALSLSGTEFKSRHIRVTAANDFTDQIASKAVVFVGNLKYNATDEKLHEIFSTCGSIEYVRTIRNEKGCIGIAYVCYKKPESVSLALELNNTLLDDRPIRVQRYKKNPEPVRTNPKELKGPARRLLEKKNKLSGKKGFKNENDKNKTHLKTKSFKREGINGKEFPKSKLKMPKKEKSDYQGKKITNKKKSKDKKKKKPTHLQKLAKKIAPK